MTVRLLLDIDPGLDDALALDYALGHETFDLVAVTTTFGAVPVMQATHNALRLGHAAGRADLPVCVGMAAPLRKPLMHHDPQRHGVDGLAGFDGLEAPVQGADERSAARCMAEMARAHPGALWIVTGGPLGNLMQALRLEPQLPGLLAGVIVTGGALGVPGNVSPVAEYNFWQDPHAADEVATSGLDLTVLGLDAQQGLDLAPATVGRWARGQRGLNHRLWNHALPRLGAEGPCHLATLMALRLLDDPALFPTVRGRLRVVTDGVAQGQSILDREGSARYPQPGWEPELPLIRMTLPATRYPFAG